MTQPLSLNPQLKFVQYHQIPVLEINHPKVKAAVALQGAHLLRWQPVHAREDVLWLSEIEPFELGTPIRGGVPICYPWFGGVKSPSHGTARISLWELASHQVDENGVALTFTFGDQAKMEMWLGERCRLTFTHLGSEEAQLALHSYFCVSDIEQAELHGLPTTFFNLLTKTLQAVSSPRKISEQVDGIYTAENAGNQLKDAGFGREIEITHINASDIVVWNPWHKATSGMSETGYRTMLCVETARVRSQLKTHESVSIEIVVKTQPENMV